MAKDKSRGKDKGTKKKKKAQASDKKKPEARKFGGLYDFSRKPPTVTPSSTPPAPPLPPAP